MFLSNCCGAMRRWVTTAHSVSAFLRFAEHKFCRSAFVSVVLYTHSVRLLSTSHAICGEKTNKNKAVNMEMREPHLRRLAVVRPDLVDEWVPELNDADVSCVQCTSQVTVWWRCNMCGENFQATVKDRAIADKGCPRCSLVVGLAQQQQQQGREQQQATTHSNDTCVAKQEGKAPSLAETHPALLSRWDYEKNGLLRPTDVTCTSELNVWWRPAEGRAGNEQSFRCPVFAFVEMPHSVEEQKEAQKALELETLLQLRQAARISEARELGVFPEDAVILDNIVLNSHGTNNNNNNNGNKSVSMSLHAHSKDTYELSGDDLHMAIEAWERSFDNNFNSAQRAVFYHTQSSEFVEVPREEVLNTYGQFVFRHKNQRATKRGASSDSDGSNDVSDAVLQSAITDPDWVQHFTLSVDDVAKDSFALSARLVFSDAAESAERVLQYEKEAENKVEKSEAHTTETAPRRLDTLPRPPEEYENEVRTIFASAKKKAPYPRLPPSPPNREDDVAEAVPKAEKPRPSKGGVPVEAGFEVVSLASSQSLLREYTSSSSSAAKDVLFDASETETQRNTLLGQAVLRSMSSEEARALQYNRGTPRPRRTGRFRLRLPSDDLDFGKRGALGAVLSSGAVVVSAKQQGEQHVEQEVTIGQVIQAPGMPRKVARPKKKN